jgi:dihydropyrimidinase
MVDLIIKNGKVVLPDCILEAALAIDDGKMVAIGSNSVMPRGERILDVEGKFVFPGGVDPHDHTAREGWFKGTKTTSWGGTTTVIGFVRGGLKETQEQRDKADCEVAVDYSVHATLDNITPDANEAISEIERLIEYGVPSFKLFMVYTNPVDDNTVLKVLEACRENGGLLCLHAENNAMIEYNRAEALMKGHNEAIYHARTRPPITEAEAVNMAVYLSGSLKAPYMNMHLSIREGVNLLREARGKGVPVYGETCTHYLCRTEKDLEGSRGIYYICTPPLRTREHIESLWAGLGDGTLSVVSSDHVGLTTGMKEGKKDFTQVPNGLPGHEFRLPVLFSEGVAKGRITVNRLSEVFSTNPAKIYGLYPRKGLINIGCDADLVILDPKIERTISTELSPDTNDWSPYEGMEVKGWPTIIISRGKIIWEEGEFHGEQGDGEFLKRRLPRSLFEGLIL